MTLGQGHPKFNQYIFLDPYFLCPKYLRSTTNGFDVRSKSHRSGGGGRGRGGETNWKHKVTPDWGDLIIKLSCMVCIDKGYHIFQRNLYFSAGARHQLIVGTGLYSLSFGLLKSPKYPITKQDIYHSSQINIQFYNDTILW